MKIGFVDYYLDEWHANNYPALIKEVSGGEMEVAYAYGHIDSPIGGMTTDEWCAKYGIERLRPSRNSPRRATRSSSFPPTTARCTRNSAKSRCVRASGAM